MPIVLLVINMCSFYKPTCQQSYAICTLGHSYVIILLSYVPTGLCQFYSWSFICVHFIILRANRAMAAVLLVFHMFLFSYPTCQQGYGSCTLGHSYVLILLSYVPAGLWQLYSWSFICSYFPIVATCQQGYGSCTLGHSYVFNLLAYVPAGLLQLYSWSFICSYFISLRANRAITAVLLVIHMFLFY